MKKEPNILFILIDALRAKNLGCYGYSKRTSPNIDNLAKEGVLFENAFSCINATDPSLTTIFSGKYPISHGIIRHAQKVQKEELEKFFEGGTRLLPEVLKSKGYTTLAVDWLGRWHRRGYDYYSGILELHKLRPHIFFLNALTKSLSTTQLMRLHPLIKHFRSFGLKRNIENAQIVTSKAMELIKEKRDSKFFLFIHYWDAHAPYNSPTGYLERFANSDYGNNQNIEEILDRYDSEHRKFVAGHIPEGTTKISEVLSRYDGAIAFVDHHIGRLMMTLEECGISDETLVILTSDHGESLTEHGIYFGHHGLYDVTIHVPLIFKYSGFPKNKRIKGLVQHTDIVPTIFDVLAIRSEKFGLDGKSTIPLMNKEIQQLRSALYVEEYQHEEKKAIRTSEYKFIFAASERNATCRSCGCVHGDVEELYNLTNDPEETQNIIKENPYETNVLKSRLLEWVRFLDYRREKRFGHGVPAHERRKEGEYLAEDERDIMERLKQLGYL